MVSLNCVPHLALPTPSHQMRRRAPGVVGEGVELADGVDPRERVGSYNFV